MKAVFGIIFGALTESEELSSMKIRESLAKKRDGSIIVILKVSRLRPAEICAG